MARGTVELRLGRFMRAGGWGMGATTYTFRWQWDSLRLTGFDYTNIQLSTGQIDTLSINYLTARENHGRVDQQRQGRRAGR